MSDVISGLPCQRYKEVRNIKHKSDEVYVKCYKDGDGVTDVIAPEVLLDAFSVHATKSRRDFINAMIEIIIRNGGLVENGPTSAWDCMLELFPASTRESLYMKAYRIMAEARQHKTPLWHEIFDDTACRIETAYFLEKCAMKIMILQSEM